MANAKAKLIVASDKSPGRINKLGNHIDAASEMTLTTKIKSVATSARVNVGLVAFVQWAPMQRKIA